MIRQAVVVADNRHLPVAGLTVLERAVRVLGRAGVTDVVVIGPQSSVDAPKNVTLTFAADLSRVQGAFLFVKRGYIFDVALAKQVAASAVVDGEAWRYTNGSGTATGVYAVGAGFDRSGSPQDVSDRLDATASVLDAGNVFSWLIDSAEAARAAGTALFDSLGKRTDGPVSRWINRRISVAITRLVIRTRATPNQLTILANIVGAVGVWLVFQATWTTLAAGAFLVQMQSILDGCDGELARLKLTSSAVGEWLDNVLDDQVNIGYGVGLGYAAASLTGQSIWLWLGAAGGSFFFLHNLAFYLELALVHRSGNPFNFRWWFEKPGVDVTAMLSSTSLAARLGAFVRAFVRRDVFIFVFMLLALVRLPQIAAAGYAAIALSQFSLMCMHIGHRMLARRS